MKMSDRISGFQCSPIRRLAGYADEAKKRGIHVIHLNIGQPDTLTPDEALEAVRNYPEKIIAYGSSEGEVFLRNGLVKYYEGLGVSVDKDDILITTGGSEAIEFIFTTLCDPYDEFIVPEPYYTNVGTFANMAMVTLVPVTSSFEDNFRLPPISEFESKITERTRGIMLCSPNNPTGHVYTPEELSEILKLCEKHDIFLVVDEVYREFCYDGRVFTSVLSFESYSDRVVCIDSFSKRFSMCGSRIGAIVSKNKEVISSALKMAQARLCPPVIEERAAAAALGAPADYVEHVRERYEKRRNILIKRMNEIPGVSCSLPRGAFYFIANLPVDDAEKFAIFMLKDFSYKGSTVMFAPAEGFYVTPGLGVTEARIAYVIDEKDLMDAADCIEEGLKEYRRTVMGIRD